MRRVHVELHGLCVEEGAALAEVRPVGVPTAQVLLVAVLPRHAVVELVRLDDPRAPLEALDELERTLDRLLRLRSSLPPSSWFRSGWKRRKRKRSRSVDEFEGTDEVKYLFLFAILTTVTH